MNPRLIDRITRAGNAGIELEKLAAAACQPSFMQILAFRGQETALFADAARYSRVTLYFVRVCAGPPERPT